MWLKFHYTVQARRIACLWRRCINARSFPSARTQQAIIIRNYLLFSDSLTELYRTLTSKSVPKTRIVDRFSINDTWLDVPRAIESLLYIIYIIILLSVLLCCVICINRLMLSLSIKI